MRLVIPIRPLRKAEGQTRPHKYIRRIPKPGGGYRYIYSEAGIAHEAQVGERINIRERGAHDVTAIKDGKITLRDAQGKERTLTVDELHDELHSVYGERMVRGAERLAKRFMRQVKDLPTMDLSDPGKTHRELSDRFKRAKVSPEQAKRLVGFLSAREKKGGWRSDASKAFLAMASDPEIGRFVAPAGRDIIRGAENLRNYDQGRLDLGEEFKLAPVQPTHVIRATVARVSTDKAPDERIAELQKKAGEELAAAEAAMRILDAAGESGGARRAVLEYARSVVAFDAARELEEAAKAFPGLRNLPELERLRELTGKWSAHLASVEAPADGRPGVPGAPTTVYVADANGEPTPQKARYRLVEAGEVHPSHDPTKGFAPNKKYPEGVQERVYHRSEREQNKVRDNARKLKPDIVINTNPDAVNGPPIVTPEGVVLGGNSRTMSIQLVHDGGGDAQSAYLSHLRDNANTFGFTAAQIDEMKAPVLVREVDVADEDKQQMGELVRRYNESFMHAMDPRTDQVARARLVTKPMLDTLARGMAEESDGKPKYPTLTAFLNSERARPLVDAMRGEGGRGKSIIDKRNEALYLDKSGKFNEDGRRFVERVLVGHVIPDADILGDMTARHLGAIARAVPHIVTAAGHGHDVREELRQAVEVHAYMRRRGLNSIEEFDKSTGTFGDWLESEADAYGQKPKLSKMGRLLLEVLTDKPGADKPVKMAGMFRDFATHAGRNKAGEQTLAGQEKKTTFDVLNDKVNPKKAEQRGLFLSMPDDDPIVVRMRRLVDELDGVDVRSGLGEREVDRLCKSLGAV